MKFILRPSLTAYTVSHALQSSRLLLLLLQLLGSIFFTRTATIYFFSPFFLYYKIEKKRFFGKISFSPRQGNSIYSFEWIHYSPKFKVSWKGQCNNFIFYTRRDTCFFWNSLLKYLGRYGQNCMSQFYCRVVDMGCVSARTTAGMLALTSLNRIYTTRVKKRRRGTIRCHPTKTWEYHNMQI